MDNVQKVNNLMYIPSSQTFGSYVQTMFLFRQNILKKLLANPVLFCKYSYFNTATVGAYLT
jgi:hypothetical protein